MTEEPASTPAPDGQELDRPKAAINRKRSIIGGAIAIIFLVIVFTRVIPQIGDYQGAFDAMKDLHFYELLILFASLLIYLAIYGLPYLVATPGITFKESEIVNNSRFAIGNGIPGGGAFGLAVQYAQLTFYRASPIEATAVIGATGVWATFITLTLPVTGVVAFMLSGGDVSRYWLPALIGVAILIIVIGVFALILRSQSGAERVGSFADKVVGGIVHKFRPTVHVNLKHQVIQLREDIVELVSRRWIAITLANFGVSLGQFLILATALTLVASEQSTVNYLMVYGCWAVSQLGILIPITPGGLGTVDAALIALLSANGITTADATAASLLWRATYYFPQIFLGVICIFIWRWQVGRSRKEQLATS